MTAPTPACLFECRLTQAAELPRLLDGLEQTGLQQGWDPGLQMQLALVIEELVVNACTYGGRPPGQGWVQVRIHAAPHAAPHSTPLGLHITIEDNGQAFDPFSAPEPDVTLDLDSRAIGGLGVHFVRELTEHQAYERVGEVNRVSLVKALPPAP